MRRHDRRYVFILVGVNWGVNRTGADGVNAKTFEFTDVRVAASGVANDTGIKSELLPSALNRVVWPYQRVGVNVV